MKNYLVRIKKIEITDMIVNSSNEREAITSVEDLLNKCLENNISLDKVFNCKPIFSYEVDEVDDRY